MAAAQVLGIPGTGRNQHQRVENFSIQARGVLQRVVASANRIRQSRPKTAVIVQVLRQMGDAEGDMPPLILRGEFRNSRGDRIGRVSLDKPQERKKWALSQHRKKK